MGRQLLQLAQSGCYSTLETLWLSNTLRNRRQFACRVSLCAVMPKIARVIRADIDAWQSVNLIERFWFKQSSDIQVEQIRDSEWHKNWCSPHCPFLVSAHQFTVENNPLSESEKQILKESFILSFLVFMHEYWVMCICWVSISILSAWHMSQICIVL